MSDPAPARSISVVIVGAGMSGLAMAAKLLAAGHEDLTVLEKAAEVGGTWRDNTYPGLTCDVPSPFYSYSFAPNAGWTRQFATGSEIHAYLRMVADRHGLRARIRFGEEVVRGRWEDGGWTLTCASGTTYRGDVVVTATGVLHHPHRPDIPGLADFVGPVCHSARWDHSIDPTTTRVAVIGTGSTGTQIVSALAGVSPRVVHFARSAQWMVPARGWRYTRLTRSLRRRFPVLSRAAFRGWQWAMDTFFTGLIVPGLRRRLIGLACRANLRRVRDPELRRRLTPDHEPGCRRLVMSWAYYGAVQRPDVELVTEPIVRVTRDGVLTADGRAFPVDAIVLATGFDAHAYLRPMELEGPGGTTLSSTWRDRPRAYKSILVPGLPNAFMLMGPYSPIGNTSLFPIAEAQADAVVRIVDRLARGEMRSVAATEQATTAFEQQVREALPGTVWTTGCDSWYLTEDGTPLLWPFPPKRFYEELAAFDLDELAVER